jgi:hypothetical protein
MGLSEVAEDTTSGIVLAVELLLDSARAMAFRYL